VRHLVINRQLKEAIIKKGDMSASTFYRQVQAIKEDYGAPAMADEIATYLLALKKGLKPTQKKYGISSDLIEKTRQYRILVREAPTIQSHPDQPINKKLPRFKDTSKLGSEPLLENKKLEEALKMGSEAYPFIYVIENSIRELIIKVFTKAYPDKDWWNENGVIPNDVLTKVQEYQENEAQKPWPGKKEDVHPIYYALLPHLEKIITTNNNWGLFKPIIKDKTFIQAIIKSINTLRNTLMHCNPLSPYNIKKIKDNVFEWQRMLREAKREISKLGNHP